MYPSLIRPLLFRLDPERAHNLSLRWAERAGRAPAVRRLLRRAYGFSDQRLRICVAGMDFANPLGLAAGYDKNGRATATMGALGFGHVEIGSISAYPSEGNPLPRVFRIPADQGVVNSYGLPSDGAKAVAARLCGQPREAPLGINLVKTNDPARPATDEEVQGDYARSLSLLQDHADYLCLNLSCPNTEHGRDFFGDPGRVDALLAHLRDHSAPRRPVFLKLKPTVDTGFLCELIALADGYPFVAGFALNLPPGKPAEMGLTTPPETLARMPGAVSGKPCAPIIDATLARLYKLTGPRSRYALIAAGGVFTAEDAYRKLRLGASLVQVYTGLIYRGPGIVRAVLGGLVRLLERDGLGSVSEAVGREV